MHVSASAYPWDVAHLGAARVLGDFVEQGIQAIDLASAYHPIDALSPRGGTRLFTSPRGAVHFPARSERYGRIKPSMSSPEVCAVWPEVADLARDAHVAVHAWTVTLFQPWIIDAHPDCARVVASGDPVASGVCPANDDVRVYLAALCADVVDQFGVHLVGLESVMPLGYDVDWLRPRVLVDVSRLARELLTLCFCASCVRRGTEAGLDVTRLRRLVREAISAELTAGPGGRGPDVATDAELQLFLAQHEHASIELVEAVAQGLRGSNTKLASTIRTPFPSMRPTANDALTEELAELVDQLAVGSAASESNRRIAAIAAGAPHPVELSMLITRGLSFRGLSTIAEDGSDPLASQLEEAVALDVSEIGLYNYGLLRDSDIRLFMAAVGQATSGRSGPPVPSS